MAAFLMATEIGALDAKEDRMTDVDAGEPAGWIGRLAVGPDGGKIGRISDIYLNDDTGRPEWVAVMTGLFGAPVSFVPIVGAGARGDDIVLGWDIDTVRGAPPTSAIGELTRDEEAQLYAYYGRAAGSR